MKITEQDQRYYLFKHAQNNTLEAIRAFIAEVELIQAQMNQHEAILAQPKETTSATLNECQIEVTKLATLKQTTNSLKICLYVYQCKVKQNQRQRIQSHSNNTFLVEYFPELTKSYQAVFNAEEQEFNLMRSGIQYNRSRIEYHNELLDNLLLTDTMICAIALLVFYLLGMFISHWLLLGLVGVVVLGFAVAAGLDLLIIDHDGELFDYIDPSSDFDKITVAEGTPVNDIVVIEDKFTHSGAHDSFFKTFEVATTVTHQTFTPMNQIRDFDSHHNL